MKTANVKDNALGIKKGRKYKPRSRDTLLYLYRNINRNRNIEEHTQFRKISKAREQKDNSFFQRMHICRRATVRVMVH